MKDTFNGKTVVLTGAGAGIGRALALKLAKARARVWAVDVNENSLAELADEAGKFDLDVTTRVADVASLEALTAVRDEVNAKRLGLDYWVNNAGIAKMGEFLEISAADFNGVVGVNLIGVVNGTRVALETMEQAGKGRIVNMASVAGFLPAPFMTSYVATKHAVVGFTRALRGELKQKGSPVSLLLVSPGFVDTQIINKGAKLGFPEWLSFLLSKPDAVADEIMRAMASKRTEIFPTFNGKLMKKMFAIIPHTTVHTSKLLLTKSWKDVVLNRYSK